MRYLTLITTLLLAYAFCWSQGSSDKAKRLKSSTSPDIKPMSKYSLLSAEASNITEMASLVLTFNRNISGYKFEKGNFNDVPVYSILIPGCDSKGVKLPKLDGAALYSEAVNSLRSDDTLDTYLHFYLEETIAPIVEQKGYLLRIQFPADNGIEALWPHNIQRISYLSENPFNLSVKLEFDENPQKQNIFLTKNNRKLILIMENTVMDTNRFPHPAVPFIKSLKQEYSITKGGISFCLFEFISDGRIEFKTKESGNKIFLDLRKRATVVVPGWLD